jgi:hypothetical protein
MPQEVMVAAPGSILDAELHNQQAVRQNKRLDGL